jgi:hypothetical protein
MKVTDLFESKTQAFKWKPSVDQCIKYFAKVNADCIESEEPRIRLTDWETHADQIQNIFEDDNVSAEECRKLAKEMAAEVKKRVANGSLKNTFGQTK